MSSCTAITFMRVRSSPAGWTISAASMPSKAPSRAIRILPPPPSSAGVPSTTTRPPASAASAAAARPAPRPAVAMMLCPHAWPMPGQGVVLEQHGDGGPGVAGPSPRRPCRRRRPTARPSRPSCLQHAGEEVVGEVLLVVRLRVLVDLVGQLDRAGRPGPRPRPAGAP